MLGKSPKRWWSRAKNLPRIFLGGIAAVTVLYLLLNIAYFQVLPFDQIAGSKLVAADVMAALFGSRAGIVLSALALLVVLASLNGNIFVTPRVIFGLAREGLGPALLARVNPGGSPWVAMLFVGVTAMLLAFSGSFEKLLALSITLILVVDSIAVLSLLVLRRRDPGAPFHVPLYPVLPLGFVLMYLALFVGAVLAQPAVTGIALVVILGTYLLGMVGSH